MSSVGTIGNRYDVMINSQSNTAVSSVAAQRPENLSFHNLAISSTGHPPGCSCPICSGQRSITVNTPVTAAKSANFDVLKTTGMHGAGCTCPICSGQRALTIKTNISTNVAKGANFNALVTAQHGAGCNCPICSGQRSLSIKTPEKAMSTKNSTVHNNPLNELVGTIKNHKPTNPENEIGRVLIKSDNSPIKSNQYNATQQKVQEAVTAKEIAPSKKEVQEIAKNEVNIQQATKMQKTVARNISINTTNVNVIKSSSHQSATFNNVQVSSNASSTAIATNVATNNNSTIAFNVAPTNIPVNSTAVATNVAMNNGAINVVATNIPVNSTATPVLSANQAAPEIATNATVITLTTALSKAANINIPQDRVFVENIAGRIAISSGDKPVKLNMMTTLPLNETLVLKGKNAQLILEKENLKMDKIVFGEIKNDKNKTNKLPNDLPPMISFNALSNALRSKDINKNNLAKLFMLLTGKFMDEDQITEDLEGMFGVWKDYIKKLREKKERQEEKQKNDQEKNKKNKHADDNEDHQQPSEKGVEVAA